MSANLFPEYIMERCHSILSLQRGRHVPAKYNLVKIKRSKSERNMTNVEQEDNNFKSKKRKLSHTLSKSNQELSSLHERTVVPSIEKQKVKFDSSQEDLWKSIMPDYNFLMADDLVAECQETKKELQPTYESTRKNCETKPHHMLSFEEFLERFNNLHDVLHGLQMAKARIEVTEVESDQFHAEGQYLKDQASLLKLMNPELRDDVSRRCTILTNKMTLLDRVLHPKRAQAKDSVYKSMRNQMKEIRKWLQEIDGKLRKLKLTDGCLVDEINDVLGQEKILQRDIESRGKELTALVRQCQSLEGVTSTEAKRVRRAAAHLEKSWHSIWIRSLEKQCLTEQRLQQKQSDENHINQELSELELDEGPLNKHRRLSLDRWTAVAPPKMDRMRARQDGFTKTLLTKDVGVHCSEVVPVNDKCIMVGTTGIAALKAEYGDDFTNFEIIQDVGYSSESSTHLSSDDGFSVGGDHYYNIRVYNYAHVNSNKTPCVSLKEELENADSPLSHSLESSSPSTCNDSGLGTVCRTNDVDATNEDSDYLETVLKSCTDFCSKDGVTKDACDHHSGTDSEDVDNDFHKKSSFTSSSQLFYKMISVDSENDEIEERLTDVNLSKLSDIPNENLNQTHTSLNSISLSSNYDDIDCFNNNSPPNDDSSKAFPSEYAKTSQIISSTPIISLDLTSPNRTPPNQSSNCVTTSSNLKRKRSCDGSANTALSTELLSSHRVRTWLRRHNNVSSSVRRRLFEDDSCDESRPIPDHDSFSSCDASAEYTSSSSDEGNAPSSVTSFEDDVVTKNNLFSGEGSVETIVPSIVSKPVLLPPPLSSPPSCLRKGRCNSNTTLCTSNRSGYSFSCHNADVRWSIFKAYSVEDLRTRDTCVTSRLKPPSSCLIAATKTCPPKRSSCYNYKHRLSHSLPSVLCHFSDSSTDELKWSSSTAHVTGKDGSSRSKSTSSGSSSQKRRRRKSKRKSSSSNRSSRSALTCGEVHKSPFSSDETRRRHLSQRCFRTQPNLFSDEEDPFLEMNLPAEEAGHVMTLKDELEQALAQCCDTLSPADMGLEEQSTVSDQVWDGYQDILSEGFSEATVDEDAVRKLTEFGDDYDSAFGRISVPTPLLKDNQKSPTRKTSSKCLPISSDSDSDLEDLHHVIEQSDKALHISRATLKRRQSGDFFASTDNAELLATCGTHLLCLLEICNHIESDGKTKHFSNEDLKTLQYLITEWQQLKSNIEMYEEANSLVEQRFIKSQQSIDALFHKLSLYAIVADMDVKEIKSWDDLKESISKLQNLLVTLQDSKRQLININVQVHRFVTEYGNYKDLKDDVTGLYQKWEEVYDKNGTKLTELEVLLSRWDMYELRFKSLREVISSEENCNNSPNETQADRHSLLRDLEDLKSEECYLKSHLQGIGSWRRDSEWKDLESRIDKKSLSSVHPLVEDVPDEDKHHVVRTKSNRFWRIVRIAVPVQLTLMLLLCFAYYMEPCDRTHPFNFSMSPQLRYPRGPPPV